MTKDASDPPSVDPPSIERLFSSMRVVHRRNFLAAGADLVGTGLVGPQVGAEPAKAGADTSFSLTERDREHMALAIRTMRQAGIVEKTGGPFGAVVVLDGEVMMSLLAEQPANIFLPQPAALPKNIEQNQ